MQNGALIFTIGTDLRSSEDFMEILAAFGIMALVDVRSLPRSSLPHFSGDSLAQLLKEHGIEYHFLGRELGGFRKGGYEAYLSTDDFRLGIARLEEIALRLRSAICCAERFPWKCHRKWIARELHRRGWIVRHILDKGKVWEPK